MLKASQSQPPLHMHEIYTSFMCTALEFGESDIFIREEQAVRPVAIQRRDTKYPLGLKVYSRTVDEYKQIQEQTGCNLTLEDIGIQESQIDPAEGEGKNMMHSIMAQSCILRC